MSDLIDRQAAIDAILHITNCKSVRELFEYNQLHHLTEMLSGGVNDAIDAVIGVDSAQLGTNLAEVGTDCISRQAAIDALRTCYDTETVTMDNGDEYINYGDAVGEIEQLPPIQSKLLQPWEVLVAQAVLPQPEQCTGALKAEIKRMKRSFTTCINSDYYTGYMSALSAVEGYIAQWEGEAK